MRPPLLRAPNYSLALARFGLAGRGRRIRVDHRGARRAAHRLGRKIETDTRVTMASQLLAADVTLFDLAPPAVADLLGDALPARVVRACVATP
jgi:hypothetical protein